MKAWKYLFVVFASASLGVPVTLCAANQIKAQLVLQQVSGDSASSANPFGVLGPGDLVSGGRLLPKRAGEAGSSTSPLRALSPGDLVTGGRVLPTGKPASSLDPAIALSPGDLVTGGRARPNQRR